MKATLYIDGYIGDGGFSLSNLNEFLANNQDATEIDVYINSGGGHTTSGYAIHDRLVSLDSVVNTIANGMVASIATVIFQAPKNQNKGGKRKLYGNSEPFIHNPHFQPDPYTVIESKDAKDLHDALVFEENKLANFYANTIGANAEEMKQIMAEAKPLSPAQFVEMGFADEVISTQIAAFTKYKIAAYLNETNNNNKMNEELKNELGGIKNILAAFKKKLFKNSTVTTAEGVAVYFDGDTIDVGTALFTDEAMTMPAPDGKHTVDANVYVVVDGVVTEILPVDTTNAQLEAANAEIANLKAELEKVNAAKSEFEAETKKEIVALAAKIKQFENIVVTGENVVTGSQNPNPNPAPKSLMEQVAELRNKK